MIRELASHFWERVGLREDSPGGDDKVALSTLNYEGGQQTGLVLALILN